MGREEGEREMEGRREGELDNSEKGELVPPSKNRFELTIFAPHTIPTSSAVRPDPEGSSPQPWTPRA